MARDGIGRDLVGKRFLITGGGTGIGAATAVLAANQGMKVMVTGRRAEPLEAVVAGIRSQGGEAAHFVRDVAEDGASEAGDHVGESIPDAPPWVPFATQGVPRRAR